MQVGQAQSSMQTMNQSLFTLYRRGDITLEDALNRSSDREELRTMIEQGGVTSGRQSSNLGGRSQKIRYT